MAITAYAVTPLLGADLDAKGSTLLFALGTAVLGSDGMTYIYARADTAHASTANVILSSGANFSVDTAASAAVANAVCRTTGGVVAGQYFWVRGKKFPGGALS